MPTEIERLYREHRAGLVRLVERELRDRDDAEDVVQTAFLDAQRALERGTVPRNPRAWLAAIALNAARRLRRRRLNVEPLEDYAVQEASGISDLRAALTSLPREQQTAVLYRDLLGLSYDETAEEMGRSVNAVTMLLHRGRTRLRQKLGATADGVGLWRWVKQAGIPQAAVVKGGAAVVAAGGLASTGVVAARAVAPIGTHVAAAAQTTLYRSPTVGAGRTSGAALAVSGSPRDLPEATGGSPHMSLTRASTHTRARDGTPAPAPAPAGSSTGEAETAPSKLGLPTVSLPTLPVTTSPVTIAATVTVSTPITAVTATTPTGTTATVTTPIATVTLPIP
ncbi:MAG TPA: sigma-70 family RNA polymerase sigma factor [Gaiellaceae bacterium]|nr:sigma-70 family RNA polymerase sigma factor [Gaiellaceae bacterium]